MKSLGSIVFDNERAGTVKAGTLIKGNAAALIGRQVWTPPLGDYPGGVATITKVLPDPDSAPEIVFEVDHPTFGLCGVFEYERVRLL